MATKKTVKAAAEEAKAVTVKAAEEAKEAIAKVAPKKAEEVKAAAKAVKKAVKKDMKVKTFVEYYGKQVEEKDMIASVKKAWTRSGKRVGDIKTMELYVKPEENAVYYVINGKETGAVAF